MIIKLKTQHLIYAFLSVLILLNLPVYFFLVRPEIAADAKQGERIEQARQEFRLQMMALDRLKEIENRLTESRHSFSVFNERHSACRHD